MARQPQYRALAGHPPIISTDMQTLQVDHGIVPIRSPFTTASTAIMQYRKYYLHTTDHHHHSPSSSALFQHFHTYNYFCIRCRLPRQKSGCLLILSRNPQDGNHYYSIANGFPCLARPKTRSRTTTPSEAQTLCPYPQQIELDEQEAEWNSEAKTIEESQW